MIWRDEQLEARGMIIDDAYGDLGPVKSIGSPLHLSDSPVVSRRGLPTAGEHNEEVLVDLLGYAPARVAGLVERGVLWGWEPA